MATYNNESRPILLVEGDRVIFNLEGILADGMNRVNRVEYRVMDTFLNNVHDDNNHIIFDLFELDKHEFCQASYGYDTGSGSWPTYLENDFSAATRCVLSLYEYIDQRGGSVTSSGINDSAARIPFVDMVSLGFKATLDAVKGAEHRVTPSEIEAYLIRKRVTNFTLEDISEVLYKLSELGILTFHQDETGQDVYFIDPEKSAHMEYLHAVKKGLTDSIKAREHALVPKILKYIKDAPSSVTFVTLAETFGTDELQDILDDLQSRRILKAWEKGYYTHPEARDEVSQIIATA